MPCQTSGYAALAERSRQGLGVAPVVVRLTGGFDCSINLHTLLYFYKECCMLYMQCIADSIMLIINYIEISN